MNAHTPGPWCVVLGKNCSVAPVCGGRIIANCNFDNGTTELANARLIAAAPKLLEALESLVDVADIAPEPNCACHLSPPCGDCVEWSALREELKRARAAIATATGATP